MGRRGREKGNFKFYGYLISSNALHATYVYTQPHFSPFSIINPIIAKHQLSLIVSKDLYLYLTYKSLSISNKPVHIVIFLRDCLVDLTMEIKILFHVL